MNISTENLTIEQIENNNYILQIDEGKASVIGVKSDCDDETD